MNWLDILMVAGIAFGALYGLGKGLVRLMFALVGVIAGVILAGQHYATLAQVLSFLPSPALANLVSYFVLFAAVTFIAGAVGEVLHAAFGVMVFGCFDQVGGLFLGAAAAALAVQAALLPLASFPVGSLQQALTESTVANLMMTNAPVLLVLLPPEFQTVLNLFQSLGSPSGQ